jgi:Tol biopolymer transport system component/DNA-binding winged helix-turn-helix (wHTH) protein
MPGASPVVRFGLFEVDLSESTLLKNGRKIKLQDQPFRLLAMLLERPGETVTRERLKEALWSADTFVDFDHSLNTAVAKLRQALDDPADNPRFIATVARRGYRFIAPLERPVDVQPQEQAPVTRRGRLPLAWGAASLIAALCALAVWTMHSKTHREEQISQLTFNAGLTIDPAISPDGKLLAYASDRADGHNLNIWVQQLTPGGSAVQLTHEDADTRQPSFSPDGTSIVFHCAKDGGGICRIPTIGGQIVRLSARGISPHISPDGKWISFQVGYSLTAAITGISIGQSFVAPASGGSAQRIGADLQSAANPVWGPDSQHLLVYEDFDDSSDWFLISTAGGPSRRTGLFEALKRQGFSLVVNRVPQLSEWQRGFILFSAAYGDTTNAWRIPVSDDGKPAGKAERLTSGTGVEASPVLSAGGSLLFESLNTLYSIWSLPLDANRAVVRGEGRRLTSGPFDILPSISLDSKWLAFNTGQGKKVSFQNARVGVKDIDTGTETIISDASTPEAHPRISSDGSSIAIATDPPKWDGIRLVARRDLTEQRIAGAAHPKDLSHDNKRLLYGTEGEIRCRDIASGKDVFQLADPKYDLHQAEFAPGDRFVAVEAVDKPGYGISSRLFIVPAAENVQTPPKDWIAIDHGGSWDDKPRWSPDGTLLYFVSDRDGHLCLWAQRLDGKSKQPLGTPFPVRHFHDSAFGMQNVGVGLLEIDVARDRVVFGMGELTGNIWSVRLP